MPCPFDQVLKRHRGDLGQLHLKSLSCKPKLKTSMRVCRSCTRRARSRRPAFLLGDVGDSTSPALLEAFQGTRLPQRTHVVSSLSATHLLTTLLE
ncbi:hypothetical protein KSP40_PGU004480 [Platanthera guangdongensis]|uniref:Uncharacterized protein n=1 Tax=Platanthera guangdongensis TaxID=2320717 RepID=A0ABR2N0Y9_9ASPA